MNSLIDNGAPKLRFDVITLTINSYAHKFDYFQKNLYNSAELSG